MALVGEKKREALKVEVTYQFSRSSGPGGQKVNKTETQVELRWSLTYTKLFSEAQKKLISLKLANQINKDGELVLSSDQFRSRERNKQACLDIFFNHLEKALHIPKRRRPTKPTRSSVEKRIQAKKELSDKKRNRKKWES